MEIYNREFVSAALKDQEIVIHIAALPFTPDCYVNPEDFFQVNTMDTAKVMWTAIRSESVKKLV